MHSAVAYIVETAIIFAILVSFYKYACYRESYFKWDRFFLLAFIVVCYALPFCKLSATSERAEAENSVEIKSITLGESSHTLTLMREVTIADRAKRIVNSPAFYTLLDIIMLIYVIGAVIKAFSVLAALIKITKLKRGTPEITTDGYKIYTAESRTPAFSFFENIYVNKAFRNLDAHSQEIILNHERQHIRGHHSVDVIIFSLLSIVQWFNPAVKKAAALSRQICENIADSQSTEGAKKEYSLLLLQLGSQNTTPSPAAANENGSLKDRVLNIFSYDRPINRKIRFASSLPILILLIGAYIIIGGKLKTSPKSNCTFPITGGYTVAAEFFNHKLCTNANKQYQISHPEVMFNTPQNAKILAPFNGAVTSTNNNEIAITTGDTTITIKNLALSKVAANVNKGDQIGLTTSTPIAIKVEINHRAINPANMFNY